MRTTCLLLLLGLAACDEPIDPAYRYGVELADLELVITSDTMGVHPDNSVLASPHNPFADGLTGDTKWDVLEDGPIAGFYAWATMLAVQPTGEHQFYAALQLHQIYTERLCHPDDIALVRELAIQGYQTLLDEFPGAVTYDATGRFAYPLGPQALNGIVSLGGVVQNGWIIATTPDGGQTVVRAQ